jgi:hypothetical protein
MALSARRSSFLLFVLLGAACGGSPAPAASAPPRAEATPFALQVPGSRLVTASREAEGDLARLFTRIAGGGAEEEKAERVVRWIHEQVVFSPARHPTVDALLDDRNGNCYDHAALVIALLRAGGVRARLVRELNVEPASEGRATSAREKKSSVYGLEHNDHTWVEISLNGHWVPADSSLGLFGLREWLGARVLRGMPNDYGMITPFLIVAFDGETPVERTHTYLDTDLGATYPTVTKSPAWSAWRDDVAGFARLATGVFGAQSEVRLDSAAMHRMASAVTVFRRTLADAGEVGGVVSPLDYYLHPSEAAGSRYCFGPASRLLRAALAKPAPKESDTFDARALADDVAFLHEGLGKMYAGFPELLQKPAFDVEKFFTDWTLSLRTSNGPVTFADGVLNQNLELRQALTDFHFSVSGWTDKLEADPRLAFVEYQAKTETPLDLSSCAAEEGKALAPRTLRIAAMLDPTGRPAKSIVVTAHDAGDVLQLTCGARKIALQRRRASSEKPKKTAPFAAYEQRTVGDVTVITIRRFSGPPETTRQLDRLAIDYPAHARSKLVVFDLRGNGGGDDHYVLDWIQRAHRGQWQTYGELDIAGGALYPCNTWNAVVWQQILLGRADDPSAESERVAIRAGWTKPRPPVHKLDIGIVHDEAKNPYLGRVVVLVDRFTRSSGESAAFALHQALRAPIVGERTGGLLEYGNTRTLVLPRTQLVWWYGTKRNYYADEIEGVGLPVDAYLERIDAPVDELLPALRRL